jgi:hypothetical protein
MKATDNVLCHKGTGVIVLELEEYEQRKKGDQHVTGDGLGDSNADLNAACETDRLALEENKRLNNLSSDEKAKVIKEEEARKKEATNAREAAATGLSAYVLAARAEKGQRQSPFPKEEAPAGQKAFVYGTPPDGADMAAAARWWPGP